MQSLNQEYLYFLEQVNEDKDSEEVYSLQMFAWDSSVTHNLSKVQKFNMLVLLS